MIKRLTLGLATVVAALTTGAAAAAPPAATSVSISGQVDFITSFNLTVYVTVQGVSPTGLGTVTVTVQQAQPPIATATGTGSKQVICDGQRHLVAVPIGGNGLYNLGDAEAFASATCSTTGTGVDTQNVRITRP